MSDQNQNPLSAPPRPPQKKRPPSGRSAPRKAGKPSFESRFVGYLILGLGALILITVTILALAKKEMPEQAVTQTLVRDLTATPPPAAAPASKKDLYFKRAPDLDVTDMIGAWQAKIGTYTVVLQFEKNMYQIIMAQPDANIPRLYSSGTYKVLEDIVVLTPQLDWPKPKSAKGNAVNYQPITRAAFPLIVAFDGGKMLWQNPPQSEKRVVVPYRSPLLLDEPVDYITWQKLE